MAAIEPIDLSEARAAILPRVRRAHQGLGRRSFKAGTTSRLTRDWPITPQNINVVLRAQGQALRARARHLSLNDPYAAKFVRMVRSNIIGAKGVTMQAKIKALRGGKLNQTLNEKIEAAWTRWSKPQYCTVNKRMSWTALQQFLISQMPSDGEFFVQRVIDKTNPFGMSLRVVDADQLDYAYSTTQALPNGNIVVMGVELTPDFAPAAYHFFKPNMYAGNMQVRERISVPATEIIHYFVPLLANQVRGFGWAIPSMWRLNMLDGYEDAEVTNARASASKMGFFTKLKADGSTYEGDDEKETERGDFIDEAEPGSFDVLPEGWDFKSFDPQHPTQAYAAFVKTALRGVAAGWGVGYNTLANDLEGVNYSSMRGGQLEERDEWKLGQNHFVEHFTQRVYAWWLEAAILKGAIDIGKLDQESVCDSMVWTPRRWAWVDPQKDAQGTLLAISNGLNTTTAALAEQGLDFEETIDQIAYEQQYMKAAGVKLGSDLKGDAMAPESDATDTGEGDDSGEGGDKNGDKQDD